MAKATNNHASSKRGKRSLVDEFIALPDAKKDGIAAQFDREFTLDETKPLSPKERRQWQQIKRRDRAARKRRERATMRVTVEIEGSLLERMEAYARAHGLSRDELVSKSAEAMIARAG